MDYFRVFTDFNLLLLLYVCSFTPQWLLSCLSRPEISLPPPLFPSTSYLRSCQSGLQTLSVQPVRLRDAFWSAVDIDRPVRWDDSRKWRRAQAGTCNVTRLFHPSITTPSRFPSPPPPLLKNKYPCVGSWKSAQGTSMFPDELRETLFLSLNGCDAATWWTTAWASVDYCLNSPFKCTWSAWN